MKGLKQLEIEFEQWMKIPSLRENTSYSFNYIRLWLNYWWPRKRVSVITNAVFDLMTKIKNFYLCPHFCGKDTKPMHVQLYKNTILILIIWYNLQKLEKQSETMKKLSFFWKSGKKKIFYMTSWHETERIVKFNLFKQCVNYSFWR